MPVRAGVVTADVLHMFAILIDTLEDLAQTTVTCASDDVYRFINTAAFYDNEIAIRRALREEFQSSSLRREDVFVTTKSTNHGVENIRRARERSLRRLGLTYIDLHLIHSPMAFVQSEEEFKGGDCTGDETRSVSYLQKI
ncbi:unnamed protein product [Schistocephalus solidus]|uniref:Aldo_ket_red domain-containing protein n=1 Tax=Schistocephalus solidus TaxID=70667 RepID=A0A183THE3_SCHSO|nr:unnamed protein product [Schistocephalus solidus]